MMVSLAYTAIIVSPVVAFLPPLPRGAVRRDGRVEASEEALSTYVEKELMPWIINTEKHGPFNQHEDWGFTYTSVPPEASASYMIDDIEGTVPLDLKGTFYKAGPGLFEREGRRYEHALDGDGFVAAFKFESGEVRYTGRFVETEFFKEESKDDKIKYRNVFGTQRTGGVLTNAFDLVLKNVANTNVLQWGGRLFALWEAGRPYELNPVTLETLPLEDTEEPLRDLGGPDVKVRGVTVDEGGPVDLFMSVGRSFTAHPHVLDADTLVGFKSVTSVKDKNAVLEFIEYNKSWQVKNSVKYAFPNGPPPHDFCVSENYFCFFANPFGEMDNGAYLMGLKSPTQIMQLLLRTNAVLHLVPRNSKAKGLQVEIAPYFNIHTVAEAIEKDGKLFLYSNGWDLRNSKYFPDSKDSVPFLGAWGGLYPDFESGTVPPSYLFETVIDLNSGKMVKHEEVVPGLVMEFPISDPFDGMIAYMAAASTDYSSLPGTGVCKVNLETSETEYWWAEHQIFTHEMVPVPKRNGETGSWLLTIFYDAGRRCSTLAIFDSERFEDGPVCRLHLRHHLSYGLHGSFSDAAADPIWNGK